MQKLKIYNLLKEQTAFMLTGKISIISGKEGQYKGAIFMQEGKIFHIKYEKQVGEKALEKIIIEEMLLDQLQYIIEPEIFQHPIISYHKNTSETFELILKTYQNIIDSYGLRPSGNLLLNISIKLFLDPLIITDNEFKVLVLINLYKNVEKIIQSTELFEHEVITGLINLKRKGLIKVVGKLAI